MPSALSRLHCRRSCGWWISGQRCCCSWCLAGNGCSCRDWLWSQFRAWAYFHSGCWWLGRLLSWAPLGPILNGTDEQPHQILLSENRDSDVPGTDGPSVRLEISDDRTGMESRASPPTRDRWRSTSARRTSGPLNRRRRSASICGRMASTKRKGQKAAGRLVLLGNARARGLNVRSNSRRNCRNDCCSLSARVPNLSSTSPGRR